MNEVAILASIFNASMLIYFFGTIIYNNTVLPERWVIQESSKGRCIVIAPDGVKVSIIFPSKCAAKTYANQNDRYYSEGSSVSEVW